MLPLALASNVLLIPQGAFLLEFKSMAELWLHSKSNAPVRYVKRKKKSWNAVEKVGHGYLCTEFI